MHKRWAVGLVASAIGLSACGSTSAPQATVSTTAAPATTPTTTAAPTGTQVVPSSGADLVSALVPPESLGFELDWSPKDAVKPSLQEVPSQLKDAGGTNVAYYAVAGPVGHTDPASGSVAVSTLFKAQLLAFDTAAHAEAFAAKTDQTLTTMQNSPSGTVPGSGIESWVPKSRVVGPAKADWSAVAVDGVDGWATMRVGRYILAVDSNVAMADGAFGKILDEFVGRASKLA